jgi:hypothetical protein
MRFGKRSEKLDPDQLDLALEDLEQAVAAGEAEKEKPRPEAGDRAARSGRPAASRTRLPQRRIVHRLIRPASLERPLMLVGMEPPLAIYLACLALE